MGSSLARIKAGQAYIAITADHKEFEKDFNKVRSKINRFSRDLIRTGRGMAIGGGAMTAAMVPLVNIIADAETAMKRFGLIFGKTAKIMRDELRKISNATTIPMTTLIEMSSSFGAIFTDIRGKVPEEQFAKLTSMAVDATATLSALAGISLPEAADRMRSAFTSTGESVDQFGLNLRQAAVDSEALRLGLGKTVRQMTEIEKQIVKLSIIQRAFKSMNISFILMSDTINQQLSLLRANFKELVVQGGAFLRGVLVPILQGMNVLLRLLRPVAKLLSPLLALFGGLSVSLLAAGVAMSALGFAFRGLAFFFSLGGLIKPGSVFAWLLNLPKMVAAGGGFVLLLKSIGWRLALIGKILKGFMFTIHPVIRAWILLGLAMKAVGELWTRMGGFYRDQGNDELADAYERWGERVGSVPGRIAGLIGPNQRKNAVQLASDIASWMFGSTQSAADAPGSDLLGGVTEARGAFAGSLTGGELAFGTSAGTTTAAVEDVGKLLESVIGKSRGGNAVKTIGTAG